MTHMKIIVCLDDNNGMLFNGRRQSRDRVLCEKVLSLTNGSKLWMNAYSQGLFEGMTGNIWLDESFLGCAEKEDYCFVENVDITPYHSEIEQIIVFRWNRSYPSDVKFTVALEDKWKKVSSAEFSGSSHDLITQEVYTL